jgi:hypothetical protein
MNRTAVLLLACLAALAAAPLASAHVTVTSVPPAGPIPPGQPTAVEVTLTVLCPVILAEYAEKPTLDLALVPDADGVEPPAYLPFVGETVPFTIDMCDPASASVSTTGLVTITPSAMAPAFQDIPLQPGAVGETNEGGDFTLQVAYAWSVKVVDANLTAGENGTLVLEVTANADTLLRLDGGHGLEVPAEVEVASPLLAGQATRRVEVPVKAEHAGNMTLTVSAQAKGRDATGSPMALAFTVLPGLNATAEGGHDHEHEHEEETESDSKGAPAPAAPLLALALLALALRRRA